MKDEQNKPEEMKIEIVFSSDRPDVFSMKTFGTITPYQLLILAGYFEFEGKYALSKIKEVEERRYAEQIAQQNQIATLKGNILKPQ